MAIHTKRAYEPAEKIDGERYLVDRIWPRGVKKEALQIEGWLKNLAPSAGLRKWFGHDPARWEEFVRRYRAELDSQPGTWQPLLEAAHGEDITLVYGAKDEQHNNAVALKAFLDEKLGE